MTWRQLSVAAPEALTEPLSEACSDMGALSVSLEDEGDQPLFEPRPGETPTWNNTRVTALFEADADTDLIRSALQTRFGEERLQGWRIETIADQPWERAWLEHFKPMRFGQRLWIVPTGFDAPEDTSAVCVNLDPGLAFGTGSHPTTALCLEWIDANDLRGLRVMDYGCGSGILAVAALLKGAERVCAVDIDAQALTATQANAGKNNVAARIECRFPESVSEGYQADIVFANILANPLIELACVLSDGVVDNGRIVLSGILKEQADSVAQAYTPFFEMSAPVFSNEWVRLSGRRRSLIVR
ncbi:50S ribosomal protein L11 methyltransferase [Candidatus Methylospira mobilis]|uniref:Ribosomal protein L11 methyltransferase n=1 Tax=Candidatus Methylospira mobilis TaxID=1808979 RepID=A0A5Q0BBQ1_9GAMM|nr:50S ribosomal protein L11 methyltransferase [Candidatus Methylospira mobilis]QFY41200.1 50S ribosomal protein L11 methyltransferase [Candidatus Methylospira mobilis]